MSALAAGLDEARAEIPNRLWAILARGERLLGVQGPPQCGKSTFVGRVLDRFDAREGFAVVRLDLDGAYDETVVRWRWAQGLVRAFVGPVIFSHLVAIDQATWPASTRAARVDVLREFGALAACALSPSPAAAEELVSRELAVATEKLAEERAVIVAVDHLDAPKLTPRPPVDVEQLLWTLRAAMQRTASMQIVLATRSSVTESAAGPDAAFAGDGTWVQIGHPGLAEWRKAAAHAEIADAAFVDLAVRLTGGHAPAMARVLGRWRTDGPSARAAFDDAADDADLLAARYLEHARAVHRYGGQLLLAIARGLKPHSDQAGYLSSREVSRALPKLGVAGLIVRNKGRWELADPLVAHVLAGKDPLARPPLAQLPPGGMRVTIARSGGASAHLSAGGNAQVTAED